MALPLFRAVETAATLTDRVLVSFSGGKDSVCVLDLCIKHFSHVEAFFMYQVAGLGFQESILKYYEDRHGIEIKRIPHFELSSFLRYGVFRPEDYAVPIISVKETYNFIRERTGIYWIAAGERIADSIWRRAMIKKSGSIDETRGRFFPMAEWKKEDVRAYIKQNRLVVGQESQTLGFSFRSLAPADLLKIREHFPKDYERIRAWFPFIETNVRHYELYEQKQV
ncbi:MAG: phosphoadenosine phosphosulfate reductase family protein [Deltaproteobacteria bacterium]|jgi:phosphoadenosine phosphosulfate reductase|nr:phosphoadenosine phosphosulfate reductase family protein [Deltaproteobacteria bacterium]